MASDTKTVTRYTGTNGGYQWIATEYVQGQYRRFETVDDFGHRGTILKPGIMYDIDFTLQEYVERLIPTPAVNRRPLLAAPPPANNPAASNTGVDIYFETVDTGERKQFFAQTAQHLILRERSVPRLATCGRPSIMVERDGWYIARPLHQSLISGFGAPIGCGSPIFHGNWPPVLAVVEKDGNRRTEVIELSGAPLDPALFKLPPSFKKVDALKPPPISWEARLRFEWYAVLREINSWF